MACGCNLNHNQDYLVDNQTPVIDTLLDKCSGRPLYPTTNSDAVMVEDYANLTELLEEFKELMDKEREVVTKTLSKDGNYLKVQFTDGSVKLIELPVPQPKDFTQDEVNGLKNLLNKPETFSSDEVKKLKDLLSGNNPAHATLVKIVGKIELNDVKKNRVPGRYLFFGRHMADIAHFAPDEEFDAMNGQAPGLSGLTDVADVKAVIACILQDGYEDKYDSEKVRWIKRQFTPNNETRPFNVSDVTTVINCAMGEIDDYENNSNYLTELFIDENGELHTIQPTDGKLYIDVRSNRMYYYDSNDSIKLKPVASEVSSKEFARLANFVGYFEISAEENGEQIMYNKNQSASMKLLENVVNSTKSDLQSVSSSMISINNEISNIKEDLNKNVVDNSHGEAIPGEINPNL